MITYFKRSLLVILLIAVFSATAYAAKVTVCHVPPGNPANFHDITISENALQAHLNHGDFVGSCLENCAALCDDGDACTQDYVTENGECVCLDQHPPVDCDDSNPCTADSCDSVDGCEYDLITMNGTACDDGDPETPDGVCTDGVCAGTSGPPLDCPAWSDYEFNLLDNLPPSYTYTNNGEIDPMNVCFCSVPNTPFGIQDMVHDPMSNFDHVEAAVYACSDCGTGAPTYHGVYVLRVDGDIITNRFTSLTEPEYNACYAEIEAHDFPQ